MASSIGRMAGMWNTRHRRIGLNRLSVKRDFFMVNSSYRIIRVSTYGDEHFLGAYTSISAILELRLVYPADTPLPMKTNIPCVLYHGLIMSVQKILHSVDSAYDGLCIDTFRGYAP